VPPLITQIGVVKVSLWYSNVKKNAQVCVMSARATAKAVMQGRILDTADRLFYQQGIRVVGVDTVAAEIGISKRTLYNYFPSKDDLIIAYLSRRLRPIEASDGSPAEQILADFDRLEEAMRKDGYRGCPFMNAVAELADPAHAAHKIAVAHKEKRRTLFRTLLKRLDVPDPTGLATQLMILGEGAVAQALVFGDPKMARAAREAARVLLMAAGADVTSSSRRRVH
jgi:AcrR family transcriptional regulator